MANLCDGKIEEDKTDSMLWLDFSNISIGEENIDNKLIGEENIQTFMEDATLKVSIFI